MAVTQSNAREEEPSDNRPAMGRNVNEQVE